MKLDSKYFDRIRVKPNAEEMLRARSPRCAEPGCTQAGAYPAPQGRGREGKFFHFCLDHVRKYNRSYNYFNGMTDADIARYQAQTATGHRPTWSMGVNGRADSSFTAFADGFQDPFSVFSGRFGARREQEQEQARRRPVYNAQRKSLAALNLDGTASAAEIKSRYKALVKRHHPDANGGDRSSEHRLREIIQAYTYLKSAGFC
ncbi:MAG: DnaJ domain-containing protein [Hyphomicrobiales bacterium]|nr:DnaJ domain-containing protein [Hyphomicrobiales bacterium]